MEQAGLGSGWWVLRRRRSLTLRCFRPEPISSGFGSLAMEHFLMTTLQGLQAIAECGVA